MIYLILLFTFPCCSLRAHDFSENTEKRVKLSEQDPLLALPEKPIPSLTEMTSRLCIASIIDSISYNQFSWDELDVVADFPRDVQSMWKELLIEKYPTLLESAQKEHLKLLCRLSKDYEKVKIYKEQKIDKWLFFFNANQINVRTASGKLYKKHTLQSGINLKKTIQVCNGFLYYFTTSGKIEKCNIVDGTQSLVIPENQPENIKYFSPLENNKIIVDCNKENGIDVVLINGSQRYTYPKQEIFFLSGSKKYIGLIPSGEEYQYPTPLSCLDIETGTTYDGFKHDNDDEYGRTISPLVCNEETLITTLGDTFYIHSLVSKACLKKIKMPGTIFYVRLQRRKNVIGIDLLDKGHHFVQMKFDDLKYQNICKVPSGISSDRAMLSYYADVMYVDRKICSYYGDILFPIEDSMGRIRTCDGYIFLKETDKTKSCYSYTTHTSLKEASLIELLTLLMISEQSKSSHIDMNRLDSLVKSQNARVREIAQRYMPK